MIDRIVVVDSGQVIETTESAIIAKDEADRAEKWAKYSEEQANLASNNAIAAAASKEAAAQSAQSAANTVNGFDAHAAQKQQAFDDNATSKTNTYNSNASTLLQQYNDNAAQKLSAYNSNAAQKQQAFNDNYTSKLNSFNTNASEKQAQVDASAEEARKWAIGTISEQPNGSAKYWAGQAKTATAGTLNESILTNCLTEIPQDIKLELSNGTLTLKAGSKVYNGDGTFYTNSSDISVTPSWGTVSGLFVFSVISGNSIVGFDATNANLVFSGDAAPTFAGNYAYWYDTTVKKVKYTSDAGSSWKENRAFPLCLVTSSSGVVTSIDQVFNGFGYIGNTIFALPSIKGLIPNGFNTDGSLNSTEFTTTSVLTYSYINANSGVLIGINANSLASDKYVYNKDENYNRNPQGVIAPRAMFAKVSTDSTGRVTSFNPNTAFHAVDYSEYSREVGRCAKLDEDNTFTGLNVFQGNAKLKVKSERYDVNSFPSTMKENIIDIRDKNNIDLGGLASYINNVGDICIYLQAQRKIDGTTKFSQPLGVILSKDGNTRTTVNTPQIGNNSNQIANTAWVNSKFQKVSTLPAQPDPNVTYLIPEE